MSFTFEKEIQLVVRHLIQFMNWANNENVQSFSNLLSNNEMDHSKDIELSNVKINFEYISNSTLPQTFLQNDHYSCGHISLFHTLRTFSPHIPQNTVEQMSRREIIALLLYDYCLTSLDETTRISKKSKVRSAKRKMLKRLQNQSIH